MIAKALNDLLDKTRQTRIDIGFSSERNDWKTAAAKFGKHSLKILGHPVMEDWEAPYMKELAKIAASKGGTVLELGFGMGISASYIQEHTIKKHIIIEVNKDVVQKAREFATQAKHSVQVIEGFWEDCIAQIQDESIDGILFDTYPLSEPEIHKNHYFFFSHAYRVLKKSGLLTYYSDEAHGFSSEHINALTNAGFKKDNISGSTISVCPPKDCKYWQSSTILAPSVQK